MKSQETLLHRSKTLLVFVESYLDERTDRRIALTKSEFVQAIRHTADDLKRAAEGLALAERGLIEARKKP